jgi:hypothetical protein
MWNVIKILDLDSNSEAPTEVIVSLLNKCKQVEAIYFGRLKHITQTHFLNDIITEHKNLKEIDFSLYKFLTDKTLRRFF